MAAASKTLAIQNAAVKEAQAVHKAGEAMRVVDEEEKAFAHRPASTY